MSKLQIWLENAGKTSAENLQNELKMSDRVFRSRLIGRTEWRYSEIKTILEYTHVDYADLF